MIKNKIKTKTIKKAFKTAIFVMMATMLILQSFSAFALEIETVNSTPITQKSEWGNLVQYTDIDRSHADELVEKIANMQENPDVFMATSKLSDEEKTKVIDNIGNASQELVYKDLKDIDSKFEKNELVNSLNTASNDTLESLKKAQLIETYINPETQTEEIIDPKLIFENGSYLSQQTPHKLSIPKKSDEPLELKFNSVEDQNQVARKIDYSIKYQPVSANTANASADENKLVYQNQWDNVDVVYTSLSQGIKEDLILKSDTTRQIDKLASGYHGENNWIFYYQLDLENVTPVLSDNQIHYQNQSGATVASVTAPFLIDNKGEISTNAYLQLLTEQEYRSGLEIDSSRFNLSQTEDMEIDQSLPADNIDENESSIDVKESDQTENQQYESDLSATVQTLDTGDHQSFYDMIINALKYVVKNVFHTLGVSEAQEIDLDTDAQPVSNTPEFDQTINPIEQIGLEDQYPLLDVTPEYSTQEYLYLALVVNVANLEYPIDIDPTTYIFTATDGINTANGQLLSNEITDVKLYDTTTEPTSNYSYNKELKNTLSLNNSIGLVNPANLEALYTFDENDLTTSVEDDTTTNAVAGSLNGDPAYIDGLVGSALEFFGDDEEVIIPDDDKFTFADDFSFSVWVNPDNLDNRQPVLSKGTASNWEYNLEISTEGAVEFTATALNATQLYQITSPKGLIKPQQWSHIIVNRDEADSNFKIYVNSILYADESATGSMANGTANLKIGSTAFTSATHFDGQIDELKMYSTVLTQNEILNLYENAKSKLIGWWDMEDSNDYSGQANHGVITGTTLVDNGRVGRSRSFNTTDNINLGQHYSLSPADNITVESWIKTDSSGPILTKDNEYKLEICPDGRPFFYIYDHNQWQNTAGSAESCTGSTAGIINDNNWHHLTGSYNGKYLRLYVDGVIQQEYYFLGEISADDNDLVIGNGFTGEIDELAIHNRILSNDEIYHHYSQDYTVRSGSIISFDQSIGFAEYSQLALDDLQIITPGVLQISGTDLDGKSLTEKIKLRAGNIVRQLSANRFRSITELRALNEYGESSGAKLQISQGRLVAFSPFHDANWRYGVNKVDDRVSGLWHFDESTGSIVADSSGTNNAGYLAGGQSGTWLYTREIDLSPVTPVDDYQVMLTLNPENFDYQNSQDDGGDLRFYDTNNNELSYWIENWDDTGDSLVWIKVPDSGTSVLTMKYGNSTAENVSDGENVFEFFDDFSGTTIDTSKWVEFDNGNYLSQNDKLIATGGSGAWGSNGLRGTQTFTRADLELNFRYKPTEINDHMMFGWHDSGTGNSYTDLIYAYYDLSSQTVDVYEDGVDRTPTLAGRWNNGTNYRVKMQLKSAGGNTYQKSVDDGLNFETSYNSSYSSETPVKIGLTNHSKSFEIDDLFVRKYSASEPVAAVGGLKLISEQYVAQPVWYDTNWNYRSPLYVDNSQNPYDLTNYQLPVLIDTTSLVPAQMQTDFDDVRFTESDMTTPVDYFYDSANSTPNQTKFWVQLPTIEAKTIKTFYIYYGNSGASSADSFDNVFTKDYDLDSSNIRGLWHMDEGNPSTTISDSSSYANTGTLQNGPTWNGSDGGRFGDDGSTNFSSGDYLTFDGVNDHVSLASAISYSDTSNFSLSMWYKGTDTAQNGEYGKVLLGRDSSDIYANFVLRSGYVEFIHYNSAWQHNLKSTTLVADGNWHHIAFTQDSSQTGYLYIDGRLEAYGSSSNSNDSYPYRINYFMRGYNGQYTSGSIDEVRIVSETLSAEQIRNIYERRNYTVILPTVSIANNETDSNLPAWSENGKYGSALSFDGQNDYVIVPHEESLNNTNQFTIGAWINPGALDGWIYTKSLTINPSTGVDNLQLKLTLNQSNFEYLKANGDGSDLRFADQNGNDINYWIENYDPLSTSEIWLKIPEAGTSKVYMYYGNSGATAETNFDKTFTKETDNNGLIAQWHMDDGSGTTITDNSGNSRNLNFAASANDPAWSSPTLDGGQWAERSDVKFSSGDNVVFDGNDYATTANYNMTANATFTAESWFYPTASHANMNGIISRGSSGSGQWSIAAGRSSYTDRPTFWTSNPSEYLDAPTTLSLNTWHHVVGTYEAGVKKLYVDGQLVGTDSTSGHNSFDIPFTVGRRDYNTNNNYFTGSIDETKIYNRALTAAEVLANYERRAFSEGNSVISLGSQQTGSPASLYQQTLIFDSPTQEANYQAKVELTGANFDYSKVQSDGGDIRFYDLLGNSLDYFFFDWNYGGNSTIYVRIPNQGTAAFYMQYGDGQSFTTEDGDNTISLYDNFTDGQFDQNKWSKIRVDNTSWNEGVDKSGWMKLKAQNGKNMSGDAASAPMIIGQADYMGIDYELSTTIQFESDLSKPSASYPKTKTGLMIYQDDDNYLFFGPAYNESGAAAAMVIIDETDNNSNITYENNAIPTVVDLAIVKQQGGYYFFFKDHNSTSWTQLTNVSYKSFAAERTGVASWSDTSADLPVYFDQIALAKNYQPVNNANLSGEESWDYKRGISLAPATPTDNYQVQVQLDSSFPYSNAQGSGEDIRFYDSNFNKLNYWIEYWNSATWSNRSSIWVNIPDAGTEKIFMYYGNSNVSSESYGELTFPFFDDFTGTTIDTDKWSVFDNGSYLSQNDKLIATGGSGAWGSNGLTSIGTFNRSDKYELRLDYKPTSSTGHIMFGWHDGGTGTDQSDLIYAYYDLNSQTVDVYEDGNNRTPSVAGTWTNGTTYKVSMPLKNNSGAIYQKSSDGGISWEKSYDSTYSSETPLKIGITNYSKPFEIDNLFVKKYSGTESAATLESETNWMYKRTVTLSSNTPADNYQVKLEMDSGDIDYANVNEDGSDIRFFDDNGNKLNYWIERWAVGGTSVVWIKIPDNGTSSFTMYYGNPTAVSETNGQATFDIYDDFEDGVLNTDQWGWTREVAGSWSEGGKQDGWLWIEALEDSNMWEADNSAPVLLADTDMTGQNYELTVRIQASLGEDDQQGGLIVYEDDSNHVQGMRKYWSGQKVNFKVEDAGSVTSNDANFTDNDFDLKIRKYDNTFRFYYKKHNHTDWTSFGSGSEYDLTMTTQFTGLSSYANTGDDVDTFFDDFRVNKINNINPASDIIASLAAEQAKEVDLDETTNIIKKGTAYSIGATDDYFYSTLGSQTISSKLDEGWSHVVQTYDGTSQKIFINGELREEKTYDGSLSINSEDLIIGEKFYGTVDDVLLAGKAFSAEEIKTIYESDNPYTKVQPVEEQNEINNNNIVTDNLVGYWPLNEGTGTATEDASTNNNTGTLTNGPVWSSGINDFGLNFDDSNDYVSVGNVSPLSFEYNQPFTLSAWIKTSNTTTDDIIVSKMENSGNYRGYSLSALNSTTGKLNLVIRNVINSTYISSIGSTKVNDGQWHHVVATYDGSGTYDGTMLYVDGQAETMTKSSDSLGGATIVNTQAFTIGSRASGGVPFAGRIDEVRVYNSELTSGQIGALAHQYDYSFSGDEIASSSAGIEISGDQSSNSDQLAIKIDAGGPTGEATYKVSNSNGIGWSASTYVTSAEKSNLYFDGSDTGVDITFKYSAKFVSGEIYKIASWYTEERSNMRGIRRSFPEVAAIIATDNTTDPDQKSIEIIDTLDNSLWMRFTNTNTDDFLGGDNTLITSVDMLNGQLYAGNSDSSGFGILKVDYIDDSARYFGSEAGSDLIFGNIAYRNQSNEFGQDDKITLNDLSVNDLDAELLAGRITLTAGVSGPNGGVNVIDEYNNTVIYGTSGGDGIDKLKLSTNGHIYMANGTDNNVINIDNIITYKQNFNIANYNELYEDSAIATYQIPTEPINDILVNESESIADEFSSNKIFTATDNGLGIIDTLTSGLSDDSSHDNQNGFTKEITAKYITESMNGPLNLVGMWIAGDQTGVASVSDRGIHSHDMSIHGFGATLSDSDWSQGVRGKSLYFDGSANYLSVADHSDFNFTDSNNLSFGAWVKPSRATTSETVFGQTGLTAATTSFALSTTSNAGKIIYEATVGKGSGLYTTASEEYDLTDTWHYLAGVHDAQNNILKIYIDGEPEADITTPANLDINNPTNNLTIGGSSGGTNLFQGNVQGAFLTKTKLTDNQIKRLYNIGLGALSDNDDDLNRLGGTSDQSQCLALDKNNNTIYVGTDNGLSEIDLDRDVRTNYWTTATTPSLPSNDVSDIDFSGYQALVATNAGARIIKTDGSFSGNSSIGQLQSGKGRDVYTDGAYNYYVSNAGLDIIDIVNNTRHAFVLREDGFNSVAALDGLVFMGTDDDGIYAGNITTMSGESTITQPTFHASSTQPLLSNEIFDLYARRINGINYLVAGTGDGVVLLADYDTSNNYQVYFKNNDGDDITKVWLNEAGDLAYYNATDQRVRVFDDAIDPNLYPFQGSTYSYDRQYSVSTTPNYIGSEVNDLIYVANTSTAESGRDTFYIATNNGVSVIQEHSTPTSGTVKHYVNQKLHDERTGVLIPFDQSYTPENPDTNSYFNTVNNYDPTRAKYNFLSDPDLAGYWDFDQTLPAQIADRSGKNNHGGFGPNTGTSGGKTGNALYLDGNRSYLVVNDNASLHPTSAFSWSGWVWKDEAISNDNAGEPILASKFDGGNNGEFVLYFNKNNKLQLKVSDGSSAVTSGESSAIGTESWHHVAATFDSGNVNFYIDGQLDSTFTVAVTNLQLPPYNNQPASMTDLYLGNDWSVFNSPFGGYIDEVAYYTRALTPEEIQSHASLTDFSNSVTVNNQDSLAYRTSANLTTESGATETFYLNFDETLSGNQGETFTTAIESELQRPNLNMISYGGNTNNNVILNVGTSGSWDDVDVYAPFVLKDGDVYKMWYTGVAGTNDYRIGYAISNDGINWQKYSGNLCSGSGATGNGCIFEHNSSGFDSVYVYQPTVIKENNIYKMWYGGYDGSGLEIGYATSSNGVNWIRQNSGNPVITIGSAGSWDDWGVTYPHVAKEGSVYKMWYSGEQSAYNFRVGYAMSTDGVNWTKYDDANTADCGFSEANDNGCMIDIGSSGSFYQNDIETPKVIKLNNLYYLYFYGQDGSGVFRAGLMTSVNGIDWQIGNEGNPVFNLNTAGQWDDAHIFGLVPIFEKNNIKHYYSAHDGANSRIGLTTLDFEAGRYGKSLRIENNDIYQYDVTNDINRSQGTISTWVKLDNTTDALHEIYNLQSSSGNYQDGLFLSAKSGQITAGLNGDIKLVATNTLTNNYWNHFVLTWGKPSANNENLKLYLNGQLIQTGIYDAVIGQIYNQLQIGGNKAESRDYLKGNIDELRIYNQALNADEITELYNGSLGNSSKINTISKVSEGTIEFDYTPNWNSNVDDEHRVLFDAMAGDPSRVDEQYNQSKTAVNRLRIWKEEGSTLGDNDRLHFGILDNDGDLYEVYTNETIDWTSDTTYRITAQWDLDNNDLTAGGANKIRIMVNDSLVAGDNFTSGVTANKKKNGTDTGIAEEITMSNIGEKFWIGSGAPNPLVNMIDNPSFELNNGSDPADWTKTGTITYDTSQTNSKYGTDAVSITGPDTTNKLQQTIKGLIPGTWTLSWWAKGSASDSTQDMDVQISAGSLTGTTGNNTDPGTTYKYHYITFANDTYGDLTLSLSANSGETVWYDGITLAKGRMDENMQNSSGSFSDFQISTNLKTEAELNAIYLAESYDSINQNATLAGETNNTTSLGVKKVNTSPTASDEIIFVGTKGYTSEGALTQITFGSPDERTDEWRQDSSGGSLTSNRVNSISYSIIRNNLAVATDDAGIFGFYDDVPASISLISPNGTEEWEGGSAQTISWNTDFGICEHIQLDYSTNGGVSYTEIINNLDDTGSYTWDPVASLNSANTTIKVNCMDPFDNELATDVSDANFIIDSTSPEFTIYNIPNPSGDNMVFVRGSGTDTGGATSITEVQYKVDNSDWSNANINSGLGTTSVEFDFSTTALDAGQHTIYVKGKDSSLPGGNELDLSTAAQRTFNVDALSISFDKTLFPINLSVNGDMSMTDSVNVTVTGYGTDYSLAIKADKPPTNRYYPSENIPFYIGNDSWSDSTVGFGWKNTNFNSGNYNDFETGAYEIFKNSFASLIGDTTTVDFKTVIDWTVPAGDYDSTVSIVVIPRY